MAEMPGTNAAPHHHGFSVQFLEKLGSRFYQQADGNRVSRAMYSRSVSQFSRCTNKLTAVELVKLFIADLFLLRIWIWQPPSIEQKLLGDYAALLGGLQSPMQ